MNSDTNIILKIGKTINLQFWPVYIGNVPIKKTYKLNFFDVDQLNSLEEFECVIVKESDYNYIDLLAKFSEVTKLPLHFYSLNMIPLHITKLLKFKKISYEIK